MSQEHWTDRKWRPMMGWLYMIVCALDFAIFPILWAILQAKTTGVVSAQWDPITLRGAGLFHMASAIVGVTAWSRGQKKMALSSSPIPTTPPPTPKLPINSNSEDPTYRNTRND